MKTTLGASVALLLAAVICAQPAHAQRAPQGSYLNSCRNAGMDGDRLLPAVAARTAAGAGPRSISIGAPATSPISVGD
jgi:hypothetical protein